MFLTNKGLESMHDGATIALSRELLFTSTHITSITPNKTKWETEIGHMAPSFGKSMAL